MKLSAIIIAKNEAARIEDCLKSVAWVDEIVLVDDYSTDDTAKIAEQYGAKIFQRHLDSYTNQKNFGIDKARNDWVLIIDADERISQKLQKELRSLRPSKNTVAYTMPFKNYLGKKWLAHGGLYPDRHTRLLNRRFARYSPSQVHEQLDVDGEVKNLKGHFIHYTYQNTLDYLKKVRKYARLEALDAEVLPTYSDILKTFYRKYFKLNGYKDGWAGFISAKLLAYYEWEKRRAMRKLP